MAEREGTVVWFRNDLRLHDNPALLAALERAGPVTCLFVLDDDTPGKWRRGGASRWWLHHSLKALAEAVGGRGGRLVLRRGEARTVLPEVVREAGAAAIAWTRRYDPWAVESDKALKAALEEDGREVVSRNGSLLFEPWTIATKGGAPFRVYSPFAKACRDRGAPGRLPTLDAGARWKSADVRSEALDDWGLLPTRPDWAGGLRATWVPGETAAEKALADFLGDGLARYKTARDRPGDAGGTSRLSPRLHWGELSPHRVWHAVANGMAEGGRKGVAQGGATFLSEILWREFAHHVLFYAPGLPDQPLREEFGAFPWRQDEAALRAWHFGRTGFPIVDAGMRQLRRIGWMHNRVRMIVGSFLVKDLLLPWQEGASWFWDELVDADLANNSQNWQWVAGCGTDAAPYFRVFNPVLQSEKFDARGDYIRAFVPELEKLPDRWIHKPWEAPNEVLAEAGITLGKSYPLPMVDHKSARERALRIFNDLRQSA